MSSDLVPGVRLGHSVHHGATRMDITNPATGERVGSVAAGHADDATAAVDVAADALRTWRHMPAAERARRLRAVADTLRDESETRQARLISSETGKRLPEATAEVGLSAGFFDWFANAIVAREEDHRVHPGRRFIVRRHPLGVVAALSPWNFPVSIPARKVAAALAAGCTVVFKPSELTPLSGLHFAEIVEAQLPAGALTTVVGDGEELANALIDDTRVAGATFTGSTEVGRLVAERCARTFTHATLELGGRAPFIVCDDADVNQAIDTLMVAKYRNNGASCISANNIFVHESRYNDVLDGLIARSDSLHIGDPLDPKTELGPVINAGHVQRLNALIEDARTHGARIWHADGLPPVGCFVAPTVVEVLEDMPLWSTEIFGPIAAIRPYRDEDTLAGEVNSWSYGLGGYVCSADLGHALALAERLEIGIIGINNGAPNSPEVPFGGFKQSGLGREGGIDGLNEFMATQTLSVALPS